MEDRQSLGPQRTQSAPAGISKLSEAKQLTEEEELEVGGRLKAKRIKKGIAKPAQLKPFRFY